ncbi:MAG: S-layer homology domain-containing protein, partial [Oscillospiraceae bacterium]|nr:S-layer homology domain-containing protein [Oscillospiraceae bacterium]
TPTPPPIPYTDVPEDAPYYDAVVWAYKSGIASDGETFGPADACTRGQVMTFLWRAMGSPEPQALYNPISDISPSDWYYKPILWAYENDIVTSTTFNPGNLCTNGEALTFLWRAEDKPMAAVGSSAIALAASNQYFTRPVAWAETNGLLSAEVGFNPSASCLRADLMSYLYWAEEQWTGAAEAKALQAEYEQIISDAQIYDVHGSGLIYADYVDVDGDGKVELLTVEIDEEKYNNIVTIYADINGHAGKSCERAFEALVGNRVADFSLCKADGQLYLFASGWYVERAGEYYQYIDKFYRLGKDAVTLEYDLYAEETAVFDEGTYEYLYTAYTYTASSKKVTEGEFKALLEKFTDEKLLYTFDVYGFVIGIEDRGLVPTPTIEVNGAAVKLSADPYISREDNEFMVPLRDVLEAMGVAVYANSDASVILASTKSDTLVIANKEFSSGINGESWWNYDNYKYTLNGGNPQDIALEFTNGKAFVPLQAIVPLFGGKAAWDGKAGAIQITSNIPDSNRMSQDALKKMANFSLDDAIKIGERNGHSFWGMQVAYIEGGYYISNGKAVWEYAALPAGEDPIRNPAYDEDIPGIAPINMYYIRVANDGTITKS